MSSPDRVEHQITRRSRRRIAAVSSLVAAATSGSLVGLSRDFEASALFPYLLLALGLGCALYLAIEGVVRSALEQQRQASDALATALPASGAGGPPPTAPGAAQAAPPGPAAAQTLHDVSNMLTAIAGHTELVLQRIAPGDPARGDLEDVVRIVERCARLTRTVPGGRGEPVLLDLNALLADMRRMLTPLLGPSVELVMVPGASHATILAELSGIEQLLLNLAVNARAAMPQGGVLRVLTENVDRPPSAAPTDAGGPGVALVVQDTGAGMDAATQRRIFEPGFTTRPPGQGTGLGLSIVEDAARRAWGTVECQSAPGRGTTFRVVFPLARGTPPAAPAPRPARERGERRRPPGEGTTRRRVLVVDDDAEVRRVVHELLEAAGFEVLTASDGAQALALVDEQPCDAVLCDIFMPNKEGIETCTELRQRHPRLRVIAMSGAAGASGYLRAAEQLGALASLHKPFTGQELVAVVRGVLAAR